MIRHKKTAALPTSLMYFITGLYSDEIRSASLSIALFISSKAIIRMTILIKIKNCMKVILNKKPKIHVMRSRDTSRRKDFSALKHSYKPERDHFKEL